MPKRDKVFVSYSHKDSEYLQRLKVHLKPFEREDFIKVWSDENIQASQDWKKEIRSALQSTAVAILLVSADFLYSDFIANEELPHLLDAAESEDVKILSFILKPCAFTSTTLSKYQAANDPNKPLISLDENQREQEWVELAKTTKETLEKFRAQQIAADAIEEDLLSPKANIKWDKVATLFWLSNDLMWIQDMTFRGASPQRVAQGVDKAIGYAVEIGFTHDTFPFQRLNIAKQELQRLANIPLTTEGYTSHIQAYYEAIQLEAEAVKWFIDELARKEQPDFKKR